MKLEEILLKIISKKNTYEIFLKLQTEKEIYDFLQEKYNYEENFEDFCEIVKECKHEFLSSCDKNELAKISGGKLYSNYLQKIGIAGLSGVLAFNGLGGPAQTYARESVMRPTRTHTREKINPQDAKALAIGVPTITGVGVISICLINKLVKSIFSGSPSESVPSFTSFTPTQKLNFTDLQNTKLCECYTRVFTKMLLAYKEIASSQNAAEYGPVFWRQWYAALYTYTRVCSETDNEKNRLSAGWPVEVQNKTLEDSEMLSIGHSDENCANELSSVLENATAALRSAQTQPVIDSIFTSLGTTNASSLVGAINKCDNRVLPGNLLALKQAIDQEWEEVKQMTGEEFLNRAGCYNGILEIPEK